MSSFSFNCHIKFVIYTDENNINVIIANDIITACSTCNAPARFVNYCEYNICDNELDLDSDINFFGRQAGKLNYYFHQLFKRKSILKIKFLKYTSTS